jgi:hypothetical protein
MEEFDDENFDEQEEENEEDEFEQEEEIEKEGGDLFKTKFLDETLKNKPKGQFQKVAEQINPETKEVHPGFQASFSFGENEYEILKNNLLRLNEVVGKVFSYKKEYLQYFSECYGLIKNFYIMIKFIIDSENRKKIENGLAYVREQVITFNNENKLETNAIVVLEEIYSLLYNIKNFHGLGFSYEKKKTGKEKYYENMFKARKKE